jgi:hypothetical protein
MDSASKFLLRCLTACLLLSLPLLAQSDPPPVASQLSDPAAYAERQFGTTFRLDPKVPPMFGDLDGDGNEDLVLVGTSSTPLLSQQQFRFKVEDPYDSYYGTGDPKITTQFGLHFDGSARCLMVVFGWRLPPDTKSKAPKIAKYVLINTPFETVSIVNLRLKKKNIQAVETVDRTTLRALVFWDGRRWRWSAQGMDGDDSLFKMPPQN